MLRPFQNEEHYNDKSQMSSCSRQTVLSVHDDTAKNERSFWTF